MSKQFPKAPNQGVTMPATRPSAAAREFLALRRSIGKQAISSPGPSGDEIEELISIAARVPDHRRLSPWRFIVFTGDARERFNQQASEILAKEQPSATDIQRHEASTLFSRAPVVVGVVSSPNKEHKTPVWEQELSCGAACYNVLLAANSAGWASCWLTEWIAFSAGINELLKLSSNERMAGFIYIGTATSDPQERLRSDLSDKIDHW